MSDRPGRYDHTGGRKGAWTAAGVLCLFLTLVHLVWVADSVRQFGLASALRQFVGIEPSLASAQTGRDHLLYAVALLLVGILALLRTPAARGAILLAGWLLIYGVLRFAATAYDDPRYLQPTRYGSTEVAILTTQTLTLLVAIAVLIVLAPPGRHHSDRPAPSEGTGGVDDHPYAAPAGYGRTGQPSPYSPPPGVVGQPPSPRYQPQPPWQPPYGAGTGYPASGHSQQPPQPQPEQRPRQPPPAQAGRSRTAEPDGDDPSTTFPRLQHFDEPDD